MEVYNLEELEEEVTVLEDMRSSGEAETTAPEVQAAKSIEAGEG